MVEMDYLIIYEQTGIPLYSYQFDEDFQISDEFLLSAFLTSLNQYSMARPEDRPSVLKLDNKDIKIDYSDELKLSTVEIDKTLLLFYHGNDAELTIGIGINTEEQSKVNILFSVTQLMVEIDQFMEDYDKNVDLRNINNHQMEIFESRLHQEVIHKFVESHTDDDDCYLGEHCPFKQSEPTIGSSTSFADRLRSRFRK